MSDKDRIEARVIIENCHGRYNDIKNVASEIARIRAKEREMALREAAGRAVDALKNFWTSDFESRTLDGACDHIESAILADEPNKEE